MKTPKDDGTFSLCQDFKSFANRQRELLLNETDLFLKRHNIRLRKYVLPVELPSWAKTFDDVLDTGKEYEPLSTIYRHKHFLKCRVLHNWSYIETKWNRASDPRNRNIPFDLRPLTSEILNQLDIINEDMLDPEFSGLLVTLNTYTYVKRESVEGIKAYPISTEMQEETNTPISETGSEGTSQANKSPKKATEQEEFDENDIFKDLFVGDDLKGDAKDNGKQGGDDEYLISKVIAGALVECLVTNERCIKCIWLHPNLTKHSSRVLLQAFLPRLMLEIFSLPSVVTETGVSTYNKFTYVMHNDLDLFPRQCWLLFASAKKMSLPRHYEPSTFEDHPVELEYGDCHTDEVGHLLLPEFESITSANVLMTVGDEISARNVACNCRTEKLKKSIDDQAWLDRLVGCTESYMYLMLPKKSERHELGLLIREGWRDLVIDGVDPILSEDLISPFCWALRGHNCADGDIVTHFTPFHESSLPQISSILPEYARGLNVSASDQDATIIPIRANANLNGDAEEWCRLRREDLIDVTSDTEVYMKDNDTKSKRRKYKYP